MSFLNAYTRLFFNPRRRDNATALRRIWDVPSDLLVAAYKGLVIWQRRLRDRNHLAGLDDHLLKDIGLTHDIRDREVAKPFWRR